MSNPNRLAQETSPYLLQHSKNPVDWYPWGPEALQKALNDDKPILVSIGYAACHWCHVMEHESFEDVQTAFLMNKYFVCIKIDREERPDLDHLFMDALMAISGQGGWPLNMFLTPDGRPFYGGTYYPPVRYQNRISWKELLAQINDAFSKRRVEIEEQASNLLNHLKGANNFKYEKKAFVNDSLDNLISKEELELMRERIMESSDRLEGGFGHAPKFPQTFTILYLLRCNHFFGNEPALEQALLSLRKMIQGGIYDQVGGGFCRYSTDRAWLAPHFEKMAYDNALLLVAMSEAYQLTKDDVFKRTIYHTIEFLKREMMTEAFSFYAAIDADSEGVEGKFYTWTLDEFENVLGENTPAMASYFDISKEGNWEGVNIPRITTEFETWRTTYHLSHKDATDLINISIGKLLAARSARVRPMTDDKILLGWNALMNQALTKAAVTFSDYTLLDLAEKNMSFLLNSFYDRSKKQWKHTYKNGEVKIDAFLDDLAFLCSALLDLYEATGKLFYLEEGITLIKYINVHYEDDEALHYYFTPIFQQDILVRKKDLYDGALPSGNAIMAGNLGRLGLLIGDDAMVRRSEKMLLFIKEQSINHPRSYGCWAKLLIDQYHGMNEIFILGEGSANACFKLMEKFIPNKVVMSADLQNDTYPLMRGKFTNGALSYYLCKNRACKPPVSTEAALLDELKLQKVAFGSNTEL